MNLFKNSENTSCDRRRLVVKTTLPNLKTFSFQIQCFYYLEAFQAIVSLLYLLKKPEKHRFFDVSRGYRNETLALDWVQEIKNCENKMVRNAEIRI